MFKKKALIILILCLIVVDAVCHNLYVISGCPNSLGEAEFPTTLHSIKEGVNSLITVRTIFTATKPTQFIHSYHDKRIVIVGQVFWHSPGKMEFAMVDMDKPKQEIHFSITYPDSMTYLTSYLFDIPDQGLYQGLKLYKKTNDNLYEIKLIGLNLESFEQKILNESDVIYITNIAGVPGTLTSGSEWLELKLNDKHKLMDIYTNSNVEMDWNLPQNINLITNEYIYICAENDILRVVTHEKLRNLDKDESTYVIYYVFNKRTREWQVVRFKGGKTLIREFGSWLAGFVAEDKRIEESPGKEIRDQLSLKGKIISPFNIRAEVARIYCPGILVLYNADTQQQYEIQTGQGDSEVLLVDDITVYYRVNDEIYRAEIGADRIMESTLLAKDDNIVYVHWAFMGP
ncbi:MAG: hypothetical protein HPY51_14705 [Candidatus Omnitrophica bacterium]|nr:hypothetical protein [Candidatus Omnitrophota bacterium]